MLINITICCISLETPNKAYVNSRPDTFVLLEYLSLQPLLLSQIRPGHELVVFLQLIDQGSDVPMK